jgi:hypothetical protein
MKSAISLTPHNRSSPRSTERWRSRVIAVLRLYFVERSKNTVRDALRQAVINREKLPVQLRNISATKRQITQWYLYHNP